MNDTERRQFLRAALAGAGLTVAGTVAGQETTAEGDQTTDGETTSEGGETTPDSAATAILAIPAVSRRRWTGTWTR